MIEGRPSNRQSFRYFPVEKQQRNPMSIWKTTTNTADEPRCANFEFSSSTSQAEFNDRMRLAEAQASEVIQEAQAQADAIRQQAFEAGLQDAELQLQAEQQSRAKFLEPLLNALRVQIETAQAEMQSRAEKSVVPIALAIARKVIARELQQQDCPSTELIREAVELMVGAGSFQIYVAPDSVQPIRQAVHEVVLELAETPQIKIHADETLAAGDLVLRTEHGTVDQRSETRIARILAELEAA